MTSTLEHADKQYAAFDARIDAERASSLRKPLKNFSTRELCELAARLGINYCNGFFEKAGVSGKEMLHFSKEEFVSMLKSYTGVYNAKALSAWDELRPYISSSNLTHAKKRAIRALVVGMNDYKPESGLNALKNSVPDARAIKKMLRDKGAEVFYGENLTIDEYNALEEQYLDALQKGDIGIMFYAGHAYIYNGASHLVTITDDKPDLSKHAVNVLKLNVRMKRRGARANVFILDCCRTIKHAPESRGGPTPTATEDTEVETESVFAYATAPNHPASDGHEGHGMYTESILRHFTKPLPLLKVLMLIKKEVSKKSGGKQQPHVEHSLGDDLYLFGQSPSEADDPDSSTYQHAEAHSELVASNANSGTPMPHADSASVASSDAGGDAHGATKTIAGLPRSKGTEAKQPRFPEAVDMANSSAAKAPAKPKRPPPKSLSALENLSAQELCALMIDMDLLYCARAFEEEEINGKDLLLYSMEELVSILKDNGAPASKAGKESRKLTKYLRQAREADSIAKAIENVDLMSSRIQERVSKARKEFVGRVWLAKQLSSSLDDMAPNRAILITGVGGTGKSFFFDRLLDDETCAKLGGPWEKLTRLLLARHCCMHKYGDSLHPRKFVNSLIGQLLTVIKKSGHTFKIDNKRKTPADKFLYEHLNKPKHTDANAIVAEVLVPALKSVTSAEALGDKSIMLVESLDKAQCRDGNTIVPLLIDLIKQSPGWLRWVATSRPDAAVKADLEPVKGGSIELTLDGKNQEADVREYVEKALDLPAQREQVEVICKKAGGLFTFAVMAVAMVKADPKMDVHSLPDTVDDLVKTSFERKYGDKLEEYQNHPASMLATLIANDDALTKYLVMGDPPAKLEERVKHDKGGRFVEHNFCQPYLLKMEQSLMQLWHKSSADFLRSKDKAGVYAVDVGLGHMLLATRCSRVLKSRRELTDLSRQYSLRHVVHHLCYLHKRPYHSTDGPSIADPLQEAARIVLDFDWLLDRLFLDIDTQGAVDDMEQVSALLKARKGDGDVDLTKCIDATAAMTKRARYAVRNDPRQIMGRIIHDLSGDTQPGVIDLVKRARECKRFRWWYFREGTLTMGGQGEDLTCVGAYAFERCVRLTSITLPSGVTSIGDGAFYGCVRLTSITLPSGVTSIGDSAFAGCKGLTSITLPSGVTSIGFAAFEKCEGLTSITLPSGVTSIGDGAFAGCKGLTSITLPSGVTSIGDFAFRRTGITSVTLPDSVTSLGYAPFDDNVEIGPATHPCCRNNR